MIYKNNSNTKNSYWSKLFFSFAIITIISGIYLIFQRDYVVGISGTITGIFLIYLQKTNKNRR